MTTFTLFLEFLVIVLVYFFLNRRIKVLEKQYQIESESLRDIYKRIKDKMEERG